MTARTVPEPVVAGGRPAPGSARTRFVFSLAGLFLFCFLAGAVRASILKPLWMDEVLSAWAARLPTAGDVISAHSRGSESCPPTYNLLLHSLIGLAGNNYLVMRLPAVLATMGTGICLFALLRPVAGVEAAAFGMAFLLLGLPAEFAIQVRPYALVTFCFAAAAVLWRDFDQRGTASARVAVFALLLVAAFSLHFYATLFIPCFGLMEAFWTVRRRRIRIQVWAGLLAAGLATFLWLPLMSVFVLSNKADTVSPLYYARPVLQRLVESYSELTVRHPTLQKLVPITFASLFAVMAVPRLRKMAGSRTTPNAKAGPLAIVLAGGAVLPLIVFAFACLVTGTFNIRYCLAGAFGISGAFAWAFSRVPGCKLAVFPVLIAASVLAACRFQTRLPNFMPPPEQLGGTWPIVIADGLDYLQTTEAASYGLKQRLVYVNRPEGVYSPDPTNENLIDRWHAIRPDLNVADASGFLADTSYFYILTSPGTNDVLSPWLRQQGLIDKQVGHAGNASIWQAHGMAGLR